MNKIIVRDSGEGVGPFDVEFRISHMGGILQRRSAYTNVQYLVLQNESLQLRIKWAVTFPLTIFGCRRIIITINDMDSTFHQAFNHVFQFLAMCNKEGFRIMYAMITTPGQADKNDQKDERDP